MMRPDPGAAVPASTGIVRRWACRLAVGVKISFAAYCGLVLIFFVSGFVISFVGAPLWLHVPWSDVQHFVEGADGNVYVHTRFYSRVIRYDRSGNFVASYPFPVPGGGDTELAAGANGWVYCRQSNSAFAFTEAWQLKSRADKDYRQPRTWRLSVDGYPEYTPEAGGKSRLPDKAVKPGEILFSSEQKRASRRYECTDGTILIRGTYSIRRVSADGELVATYGMPWPLVPFVFPWPAILVWLVGIPVLAFRSMKSKGTPRPIKNFSPGAGGPL